jgi:hypothetical protein
MESRVNKTCTSILFYRRIIVPLYYSLCRKLYIEDSVIYSMTFRLFMEDSDILETTDIADSTDILDVME